MKWLPLNKTIFLAVVKNVMLLCFDSSQDKFDPLYNSGNQWINVFDPENV